MAATVGQNLDSLLFVRDTISGRNFLVDTGAAVSIYPASKADRNSNRIGSRLQAANATSIRSYGTRIVPLNINSKVLHWEFIIANVAKPLLGADFLCHHGFW